MVQPHAVLRLGRRSRSRRGGGLTTKMPWRCAFPAMSQPDFSPYLPLSGGSPRRARVRPDHRAVDDQGQTRRQWMHLWALVSRNGESFERCSSRIRLAVSRHWALERLIHKTGFGHNGGAASWPRRPVQPRKKSASSPLLWDNLMFDIRHYNCRRLVSQYSDSLLDDHEFARRPHVHAHLHLNGTPVAHQHITRRRCIITRQPPASCSRSCRHAT